MSGSVTKRSRRTAKPRSHRTLDLSRRVALVAALNIASAVIALWLTLYRSETYPPLPGPSLATAGALFLIAMVLLYRIHRREWPRLAKFGFAISVAGLGLWMVGGTLRELQVGWGLFCVGLIPIGVTAITKGLSLPVRVLLPLGSPLLLEAPLKYLLGERTGGLTIFAAFGLGWLVVSVLLFLEPDRR